MTLPLCLLYLCKVLHLLFIKSILTSEKLKSITFHIDMVPQVLGAWNVHPCIHVTTHIDMVSQVLDHHVPILKLLQKLISCTWNQLKLVCHAFFTVLQQKWNCRNTLKQIPVLITYPIAFLIFTQLNTNLVHHKHAACVQNN